MGGVAKSGSFQMRFPALIGLSARQLLVKKANSPSAVDGKARVCRRANRTQIAAPGRATIDGLLHAKLKIGGSCSVAPGKIDPLAVVGIQGYRNSAPDALTPKKSNTEGNRSVGRNPNPSHSVSDLTKRREGIGTGSKVVVASHHHIGGNYSGKVRTHGPAKERGINRAVLMNGWAD
jgi:hypothetical protein